MTQYSITKPALSILHYRLSPIAPRIEPSCAIISILSHQTSTPYQSADSPVRPLLVQHSVSTLLTSDRVASSDGHFRAAVSADVGCGFVCRLVEGVAALARSVEEGRVAGDVGFVVGHVDDGKRIVI